MTQDHTQSRTEAIHRYINSFIQKIKEEESYNVNVDAALAAEIIVALYDRYAEEIIRPTITSQIIQNYKIASNTELAILFVSPIEFPDNISIERMLNARLAFYVGLQIIFEWNKLNVEKANVLLRDDNEIKSFIEEHIQWLYLLDVRYRYPIFSNSQVWRLFHYLLRDRINLLS
jgi:trehalose-6-phosphate synthase